MRIVQRPRRPDAAGNVALVTLPLGAVAAPGLSFAGLLRQLRTEARLPQEELAEVASLSPRSVSNLERDTDRTAH
jgi:hypothetical protein